MMHHSGITASAAQNAAEAIHQQQTGCCRCYVTRTSLKCVAPGLAYGSGNFEAANGNDIKRWGANDDTRVCFQYSAIDSSPKGSQGYLSDKALYDELVNDLKEYGAKEVQVG